MENQEYPLSIPPKWQERFLIKRIDEDPIEISLGERNSILKSLEAGIRFIQIGKYTLMLNSIKSIDPIWEPYNIPPRPQEQWDYIEDVKTKVMNKILTNKEEVQLWDRLFSKKLLGR